MFPKIMAQTILNTLAIVQVEEQGSIQHPWADWCQWPEQYHLTVVGPEAKSKAG